MKLDQDRIINRFLELVSIDNPSLDERKMADEIKRQLGELGLFCLEDDTNKKTGGNAGNLYAVFEGAADADPILFSAHLDAVAPAVGKKGIVQADGRITSDGTTVLGADDLAGIVEILEAVRYIQENGLPHRTIELLFTYGEELYDVGSEFFDFTRIRSKEAYVLDASGEIGTFLYKAPSIVSFTVTVHGAASHAGFQPEKGIHAIRIAAEAIGSLQMGKVDGETTVNVGEIAGGRGTNIVPDTCVVKGEVRSYVHEKAAAQIAEIKRIFAASAEKYGGTITFSDRVGCRAYETALDSPVVKRFEVVCREAGLTPAAMPSFGGSDNNTFAANGIAGIVLACGFNQAHSTQEFIRIPDLLKATETVAALATALP